MYLNRNAIFILFTTLSTVLPPDILLPAMIATITNYELPLIPLIITTSTTTTTIYYTDGTAMDQFRLKHYPNNTTVIVPGQVSVLNTYFISRIPV